MLPFPCAVIIHIRFIGYDLSRTVRLSTPNSVTKLNTVFLFFFESPYGFIIQYLFFLVKYQFYTKRGFFLRNTGKLSQIPYFSAFFRKKTAARVGGGGAY